jgi:hypothetical protein
MDPIDQNETIHNLLDVDKPDPAKDVIFGQGLIPTQQNQGNINFKAFLALTIDGSNAGGQEIDHDIDTIIPTYTTIPGNEATNFYLRLLNNVVKLTHFLAQQLIRQALADIDDENNPHYLMDYDPANRAHRIINHVEMRLHFMAYYPRGTPENLCLRLWEELPVRRELLSVVLVHNPTPVQLNYLRDNNLNTIDMHNNNATWRNYETVATYGVRNIPLSQEIGIDINLYVHFVGINQHFIFHDGNNNPHRLLFGDMFTLHHLDLVNDAIGLSEYEPFPTSENAISAWRKTLSSLCINPVRIRGPHWLYGGGNINFPHYDIMAHDQMHTRGVATRHYTFPTLPVLKVPEEEKAEKSL